MGTGATSTGTTSTGGTAGTGGTNTGTTATGSTGTGGTGTGMSSTGAGIFDLFNLAPELLKISAETATGTDYGTGTDSGTDGSDASDTGLEDIFPTGTLDSTTPSTGGAPVTGGESGFRDVPASAWYAPYVSYAVSNGIISPGTDFRPNDPVTRAEVAKMVVNALGYSVSSGTSMLSDFEKSLSLAPYIETAKERGIFPGLTPDGNSTFRPNDPMDRAEVAKTIVRAWGL